MASVFAAFGVVAPAEAADYFLEVSGVPGESQDAKLPNTIDLREYSWGASAEKNKPARLLDLTFKHTLDTASPVLFQRLATGTVIPSAELIGRTSGETQFVFLRLCFQDVRVTSIDQSGGDEGPEEQVSFGYGALSEQYTQQGPDGKSTGNTVFAGWNATAGALIQTYPAGCGGPL